MKCPVCEIGCELIDGRRGRCGMYEPAGDTIVECYPHRYLTMFPISIETMPLLHHNPRGKFLQISTLGCNFRCSGCISEILTSGLDTMSGSLKEMDACSVIRKAKEEQCLGIVFCVNDPIVSLQTFTALTALAHKEGLLTGCSSNGYFTEQSLEALIPHLDFINLGFKGFNDDAYRSCGAPGIGPVLRNLKILHEKGVHVETAVIYMKGREEEVMGLACHIASLSPRIPFQIMRFVPFGDANMDDEPTIHEAEILCDRIRHILPFTYLFNSPGTDRLNTICPRCGSVLVTREFFGPMGARTLHWSEEGKCECGYTLPFNGNFHREAFHEPGFFGGYRTTRAMEILQSIITCLNIDDTDRVRSLWFELMNNDYLQKFHKEMQDPFKYGEIINFLARKTARENRGKELSLYIESILQRFTEDRAPEQRPRVYYAMGYPLFALNAERIETNLVTIAGGYCVNKDLTRQGKPGVTITAEEFRAFAPEYIFISGFFSCPLSDFYRYCEENNLHCPALENKRVYALPPLWDFGSLRWVLGLLYITGILFPERFSGQMDEETERFYRLFYNISYSSIRPNRSFHRVS
ncbi:MAG: radical SAM protein [Spirochaetae bacterium HGW-Spirochaetae-1]|nr:MAG: radical SAM protein [Spirochaetae bacterium HGW-Spirochaetae-1]